MVTMAQRIEQLRTQAGLSRPALSSALGLPKTAAEKFETGRQTPTKEQQEKLASYFGVSLFYLRGETDDPTRQETWMDAAYDQPAVPSRPAKAPAAPRASKAARQEADKPKGGGTVFDVFLNSKPFQDSVRAAVLEALRSPEGQDLLIQAIRRELSRR